MKQILMMIAVAAFYTPCHSADSTENLRHLKPILMASVEGDTFTSYQVEIERRERRRMLVGFGAIVIVGVLLLFLIPNYKTPKGSADHVEQQDRQRGTHDRYQLWDD